MIPNLEAIELNRKLKTQELNCKQQNLEFYFEAIAFWNFFSKQTIS
jgi:hypothetical protein